mmetsp:Transcript_27446/g.48917  ORF Transcript_27446/g.48917 Transcript_27446/m.48917 type:complete len:239 (+) Transcript_27446:511-1227(+)
MLPQPPAPDWSLRLLIRGGLKKGRDPQSLSPPELRKIAAPVRRSAPTEAAQRHRPSLRSAVGSSRRRGRWTARQWRRPSALPPPRCPCQAATAASGACRLPTTSAAALAQGVPGGAARARGRDQRSPTDRHSQPLGQRSRTRLCCSCAPPKRRPSRVTPEGYPPVPAGRAPSPRMGPRCRWSKPSQRSASLPPLPPPRSALARGAANESEWSRRRAPAATAGHPTQRRAAAGRRRRAG